VLNCGEANCSRCEARIGAGLDLAAGSEKTEALIFMQNSVKIAGDWKDFELLDLGGGEKLERWGTVILRRPDPVAIWPGSEAAEWKAADAHYHRSSSGGGNWEFKKRLPERWTIQYRDLKFYVRPTGFKHTGLFPEQAVNWDWMMEKIRSAGRPIQVLNLFAYTGGATVACAAAGASVCHVDAAKNMVTWARENLELSGLGDRPVRWITDDVLKFIQKEKRRGKSYDAVIMDPPSFGHGPGGEVWKLEEQLYQLVTETVSLLTPNPLFLLVNSYTGGFSPILLKNIMELAFKGIKGGRIETGEVGLRATRRPLILPCGIYGRWEA